jgi:hypothetical protein
MLVLTYISSGECRLWGVSQSSVGGGLGDGLLSTV